MITRAQESGVYVRLPTACTLCQVSLEECALLLPPRRAYTLYVGMSIEPYAYRLMKHIGATTKDNPFAPYINVVLDTRLERQEWYLAGGVGEAFGSEGL